MMMVIQTLEFYCHFVLVDCSKNARNFTAIKGLMDQGDWLSDFCNSQKMLGIFRIFFFFQTEEYPNFLITRFFYCKHLSMLFERCIINFYDYKESLKLCTN